MRKTMIFAMVAALAFAPPVAAQLNRVGSPTAAVADAVEAKGAIDTLYISGITPPPLDAAEPAVRGLRTQGYGYDDVVMLHVYLVADPAKGGKMDFAGTKEDYGKFFGTTSQPGRPARATIQVAKLVDDGQLVEIAAIAVKTHKAQ